MTIFYSPSTKGFYDDSINDPDFVPQDAIAITDSTRTTLLNGLISGNIITIDGTGQPILSPQPADEKAAYQAENARLKRNQLIADSDWTELPSVQALHASDPAWAAGWAAYRQALRDITSQPGFPGTIDWPTQPA